MVKMSDCRDVGVVLGCYNDGTAPVTVAIHYTHDHQGAPAVRITDLAGAVVAGATLANTALGACHVAPADVEWEMLCDVQADGSAIEFFRRSITTFSAAGVPTVAVSNWALDKVTAYVPVGTVDACPSCAQLPARGIQAAW
jgi:hypothetical protein